MYILQRTFYSRINLTFILSDNRILHIVKDSEAYMSFADPQKILADFIRNHPRLTLLIFGIMGGISGYLS